MLITIVICTHNRVRLLERTLVSINEACRPERCSVEILVIANACTDATGDFLDSYIQNAAQHDLLPLRWTEEPVTGKSHALNTAIRLISGGLLALVDDDHRISGQYLVSVCRGARENPLATMFCGRILPDWEGWEPAWAHETGPYAIYPLPVPRYDQGDAPKIIGLEGPLAGGGNLSIRHDVFERTGGFSAQLGPSGHDLGGGEDSEFVTRALNKGERLQYIPDIVQYHYVDPERFRLRYLLQKSYQRSLCVSRIKHVNGRFPPKYLWWKLLVYLYRTVTSLYWPEMRFYLTRIAAASGEISAYFSGKLDVSGDGT